MSKVLPILFNTEMVQAILDGRKTVTRRCLKPQPTVHLTSGANWKELLIGAAAPYHPGDILWVRETVWQKVGSSLGIDGETTPVPVKEYKYVATDDKPETEWRYSWWKRPSIHMPKEAARIFLKVTDVRVERLQDMTEEQAIAEGTYVPESELECGFTHKSEFAQYIWDYTVKKSDLNTYGWDANPYVWVIEFERCEKPEGFV